MGKQPYWLLALKNKSRKVLGLKQIIRPEGGGYFANAPAALYFWFINNH
jgi:hypothetical protein